MLITVTKSNHQKDLHCKPARPTQAVVQELNLIKKNTVLFSLIFCLYWFKSTWRFASRFLQWWCLIVL